MASKSLRKAEVDVLVLQSGRELERLARELVPDEKGPDGKPLTLGPRVYQLKGRLSPEAWAAFHRWSAARNAYVHGETASLPDRDAFLADYRELRQALEDLTAVEEPEGDGMVGVALFVIAVVVTALLAC